MNNNIKQFFRFLKDNDAYYIFKQNIWNKKNKELITFLTNSRCHNFITAAFAWRNTEQGQDFWHPLNNEWKQIIKLNKL